MKKLTLLSILLSISTLVFSQQKFSCKIDSVSWHASQVSAMLMAEDGESFGEDIIDISVDNFQNREFTTINLTLDFSELNDKEINSQQPLIIPIKDVVVKPLKFNTDNIYISKETSNITITSFDKVKDTISGYFEIELEQASNSGAAGKKIRITDCKFENISFSDEMDMYSTK